MQQNLAQHVPLLMSFTKVNVSNVFTLIQTVSLALMNLLQLVQCVRMDIIYSQVNAKNVKQIVHIVWDRDNVLNVVTVTGWIKNSEVQQVFAKHVTVVAKLVTVIHYFAHHALTDTILLVHIVCLFTTSFYKPVSTWITT